MKNHRTEVDAAAQRISAQLTVQVTFTRPLSPNASESTDRPHTTAIMPCGDGHSSEPELVLGAARELAAFAAAVSESFGRDHAGKAVIYWLDVFERLDQPGTELTFRQVTIHAASRLAADITGISPDHGQRRR